MWSNFINFVQHIFQPIKEILNMLSPGLGIFVSACIAFIVALAIKRGVTH